MRNSFDYYKQVESPDMFLCNPDQRFLCALNGENRHLVLRFNDLSELTFTVPRIEGAEGNYDLIETKRLIYVDKIGWFQITNADEITEGDKSYKSIIAKSHQVALKDRGFVTENRLYMFYNPNDPRDELYDSENLGAIPSVVGQMYQQLGINIALNISDINPTEDRKDWTLIYIDPILKFSARSYTHMYEGKSGVENICRSFEDSTELNAYDFIFNKAESAFEVIFEFDFLYHTIKVKSLDEITKATDIYLSFENIINSLTIKENADDIVTVMSCEGDNLDIRTVNPMGTNYIVDFNYYKKRKSDDGTTEYPWMSKELIDTLDLWEVEFEKWQEDDPSRTGHEKGFSSLNVELQELYTQKSESDADIQYANLMLTDLQVARDQFLSGEDQLADGSGWTHAERVDIGSKSLLSKSMFYDMPFADNVIIVGHENEPTATKSGDGDNISYIFSFDDAGTEGTPKYLIRNYIDTEEVEMAFPIYFMDGDTRSYCKLIVESEANVVKDASGNFSENGTVEVRGVTFTVKTNSTEFMITPPSGEVIIASQANGYFIYDEARYRIVKSADAIVSIYSFFVAGFERYTTYSEMKGDSGWCSIWENHINKVLRPKSSEIQKEITIIESELQYISGECNVQKFVHRQSQELYNELSYYWIEGNYTNDSFAAYDETTISERIELAKELMAAGKIDLSKCAQPKFEMAVDAINFIKIIEFKRFTDELELGKVITIEKEEGIYYRPALLTLEYDLDSVGTFTMTFSNASKPGDTSMTFADLIKESTSSSRTVAANWSNLMDYARNKETIASLIDEPLDRTLRAAKENMAGQAFVIDDHGILGRKYDDDSMTSFLPKQLRMMNNLLIFTDDNWDTAKTALGEIVLPNGSRSYGLIAETMVGNLLLGDNVIASNNDGTVVITGDGIAIKNAKGVVVFEALNNGNITVSNYASQSDLDALGTRVGEAETSIEANAQAIMLKASQTDLDALGIRVGEAETAIEQTANEITAYAKKTEGSTTDEFSYVLAPTGFTLSNGTSEVFKCDKDGVVITGSGTFSGTVNASSGSFTGNINATSGSIGAFEITKDGLESEYIKLNSKEIRFPIQSSFNLNDELTIYTSQAGGVNTSYITTVNTSDFIIQNLTGAGIKFSKDKTPVSQTITMTFNGPNLSAAGDKGNALVINYNISSPESGWGASYDFHYTATLSAALPYPCTKTAYVRYLYNIAKTGYRTQSITLNFPAFTTSISGSVNLKSWGETNTRYNPNDSRFETGVYFTSYGSRTNQATATVTSFSSTNNTLYSLGNFSPEEDKKYSLGANGKAWGNLYLYSGTQVGSDSRLKNSIEKLSEEYDMFFDKLTPVSYILNNGTSHRRHIGFIAQDVEDSLHQAGIDTKNFAGLCAPSDNEIYYMLRYDEFVALNTQQIQKLKNRVLELEQIVATLKNGDGYVR